MEDLFYSCGQIFYRNVKNEFLLLCTTCNSENFDKFSDFKQHFQRCYLLNSNRNEAFSDLPNRNSVIIKESYKNSVSTILHLKNESFESGDFNNDLNHIKNERNIQENFDCTEEEEEEENKYIEKPDNIESNLYSKNISENNNNYELQSNSVNKVKNSNIKFNNFLNESTYDSQKCIEIEDSDESSNEEEIKTDIDIDEVDDNYNLLEEQPIFDCDSLTKPIIAKNELKDTFKNDSLIVKNSLQCKLCEKYFNDVSQLKIHHQNFHTAINTKFYRCTECELSFSKEQSLVNHKKIAHNIDVTKIILSSDCKETCKKNKKYLHHQKTKEPKQYNINKDETSNEIYTKLIVEQTTQINRKYCKICGKRFKLFHHLIAHEKKHSREKKLNPCKYCDKSFVKKGSLIDHERTVHTKETPYKCEYCTRSFTTDLKRHNHQNIHTGEKPYKCKECNEGFMTSTKKYRHMLTKHCNVGRFNCRFCTKEFYISNQRYRHESKIHKNLIHNSQNVAENVNIKKKINLKNSINLDLSQ